ncbi:MAG: hypothetical protein E7519_08840 [Ruminococcaceae bacterium]|nr:hypothetical protein [Oscillospiraceae bacterium]
MCYEEFHIVAYALSQHIEDALRRLSSIEAFQELNQNGKIPNNSFLLLSYNTLCGYLIIQTAAIFDPKQTCGKKNCSIDEMRALIDKYSGLHTEKEKKEILSAIDSLAEQYKHSLIKNVRIKKLAHHDLEKSFDLEPASIPLGDIKQILVSAYNVVSEVFEYRFGVCAKEIDYEQLKNMFKKDLHQCIYGINV